MGNFENNMRLAQERQRQAEAMKRNIEEARMRNRQVAERTAKHRAQVADSYRGIAETSATIQKQIDLRWSPYNARRSNQRIDPLPIGAQCASPSANAWVGNTILIIGVAILVWMFHNASSDTIYAVIGCGFILSVIMAVLWAVINKPEVILYSIAAVIWYYYH